MCGRLAVAVTPSDLERAFPDIRGADALGEIELPRYNVAPTDPVPAVVAGPDGPEWAALRWWLTPRWAREQTNRYATFNARAEDVAAKPAFRASFRGRRCLVVGTAFYEWEKLSDKRKQPYAVRLRSGEPLARRRVGPVGRPGDRRGPRLVRRRDDDPEPAQGEGPRPDAGPRG